MTEAEFHSLVVAQTGLDLDVADLAVPLDDVDGWDSVYLLKVITALEQRTGRSLPVTAILDAVTLEDIRKTVPA